MARQPQPTEKMIYTTGTNEKLDVIAKWRLQLEIARARGLSPADQLKVKEAEACLDDLERRVRLGARMAARGMDIVK